MSFLAACLVLVTGDEETSYWLYAHLIEEVLSPFFFGDRPLLLGYHADSELLNELVSQLCPRLAEALGRETVNETLSLLSIKWFVACFLDYLPVEPLLTLWDSLLLAERPSGELGAPQMRRGLIRTPLLRCYMPW
jgi:hypothetical protein